MQVDRRFVASIREAAGQAGRAALNRAMAVESDPLSSGREVSLFPPVTGG